MKLINKILLICNLINIKEINITKNQSNKTTIKQSTKPSKQKFKIKKKLFISKSIF